MKKLAATLISFLLFAGVQAQMTALPTPRLKVLEVTEEKWEKMDNNHVFVKPIGWSTEVPFNSYRKGLFHNYGYMYYECLSCRMTEKVIIYKYIYKLKK